MQHFAAPLPTCFVEVERSRVHGPRLEHDPHAIGQRRDLQCGDHGQVELEALFLRIEIARVGAFLYAMALDCETKGRSPTSDTMSNVFA